MVPPEGARPLLWSFQEPALECVPFLPFPYVGALAKVSGLCPSNPPAPRQAEERGPCPQLPGTTQLACSRGYLQTARHSPCWASTLPVLLPGPGFWNIVGP